MSPQARVTLNFDNRFATSRRVAKAAAIWIRFAYCRFAQPGNGGLLSVYFRAVAVPGGGPFFQSRLYGRLEPQGPCDVACWMPSSHAEHCRQKAAECEDEAKRAPSPSLAATWLSLAKQWHDMADQIERHR